MNEKRYRKGAGIRSIRDLAEIVFTQQEYIYLDEKPLHPFFIANFSLGLIHYCLRNGRFCRAELNKKGE